jgi:hypothetical protein
MELEKAATQSELSALLERSKIESQKSMSIVTSHSGRALYLTDTTAVRVLRIPNGRAHLASAWGCHHPISK